MGEAEGGHRQQAGDQGETGQGRGAHDAMRSQHGLVVDMKTSGCRPAQVCGRGGVRRGSDHTEVVFAGAAREVEQREKDGRHREAAGGAAAGERSGPPPPEVLSL